MANKTIRLISCVLVLCLALATTAGAADPSLVGWWKLDETSGLTAADSSGNNNNGTLVNMGPNQWVKGIKDGALEFTSDNHNFVNCGTGSSLNLAKDADFTIAA